MANSDFFLRFGSDAGQFSQKISSDLEPGINSIYKLAQALADYDVQAERSSKNTSNPIANTLNELDRAAAEFRSLGSDLASTLQASLTATSGLAGELKSLLESIKTIPGRTKKTAADLAALKLSEVTPEDARAAQKQRTLQSTLDTLAVDSEAAQKQLTRVARVNASIATTAEQTAGGLQNVAKGLREVLQVSKDRGKALAKTADAVANAGAASSEVRISNSSADPIPVRVVGGELDSVGTTGLSTSSQPVVAADDGRSPHHVERPAPAPAKDVRAGRPDPIRANPETVITDALRGKTVLLPGEKQGRFIGYGARPDETVGAYKERTDAVRKRESAAYKDIPVLSPEDKQLLTLFQKSGGRVAKDLITRIEAAAGIGKGPAKVARLDIDQAKGIEFKGALTKDQIDALPGLLQRVKDITAKTNAALDKFIEHEIARDPMMTQDGLRDNTKTALRRYDQNITEGFGARVTPARGVGEPTSFRSDTQVTAAERAGAENRRAIAARGQEAAEAATALRGRESTQALERAARLEAARRQSEQDIDDARHNTGAHAPQNERSQAAGLAGARLVNAENTLGFVQGIDPKNLSQLKEAGRRVNEIVSVILADLDKKIAAANSRIGRLQSAENPHGPSINEAQRKRNDLVADRSRYAVAASDKGVPVFADLERVARLLVEERSRTLASTVVDTDRPEGYRTPLRGYVTPEGAAPEANAPTPSAAGGGGKPPVTPPPAPPTTGSNPEPDPDGKSQRQRRAGKYDKQIQALDADTQAMLAETKARIQLAATHERNALVAQAAEKFRQDPAVITGAAGFEDIARQRQVFAGALGIGKRERNLVGNVLPAATPTGSATGRVDPARAAAAAERADRADRARLETTGNLQAAILREIAAEERLVELKNKDKVSTSELLRAEAALAQAKSGTASAMARQEKQEQVAAPQTPQQKLFGQKGFIDNQIRHIGLGVENIIGYSLVFTGFEKLRELVHTGLEADAVFVRLQASLDATGKATGSLRTELAGISSDTATPLQHVIEATSELAGMFKNTSDLAFGVKIAAQLANISQGTLTAKEAAVGLRDVIDAYGADWERSGLSAKQAIQITGDQIASLSQRTGVGVKDIVEGTTQFAQEAHDYHLTQGQSSTLAAYASQATGEPGKESAAQTSRFLATLNSGKVQSALVKYQVGAGTEFGKVTREDFASGNMSAVLDKLLAGFDKLTPSAQQAITALSGTGIQARVFSALMHDGTNIIAQFNDQQDNTGALARQNSAYLHTVAGSLKQLDEDFQNIGNTLTRLGAFDFLGGLAKSLDGLLKAFNATFGRIADVMDKSSFTKGIMHISVVLLEAAAAFKIFGGAAAAGLGRMGLLTATSAATPGVGGAAGTPANYGRLTPGRLMFGTTSRLGSLDRRIAGGVANGFAPDAAQVAGLPRGAYGPFPASIAGEEGQAGLNPRQRIGAVVDQRNLERNTARIAAQQEANGMYRDTAGRMRTATGQFGREASAVASGMPAQTGLSRMVASTGVAAEQAATNGFSKLRSAIGSSTFQMVGMMAALVAVGVIADKIMRAHAQDNADSKTGKAALADLDGTNATKETATQKGAPNPDDPLQQAGRRASSPGVGFATWAGRLFSNQTNGNGGFAGVSGKYNDDFIALTRRSFGRIAAANKIGKDGSPERVKATQDAINANNEELTKQADGLVKEAGGTQAQTQATAELAELQRRLADSGQRRLEVAKGLNQVDILSLAQIDNLSQYVTSISGLGNETLSKVGGLVALMQSDTTIDPTGKIGAAMQVAANGGGVTAPAESDSQVAGGLAGYRQSHASTQAEKNKALQFLIQSDLNQGNDKFRTDKTVQAPGAAHDALKARMQADTATLDQLLAQGAQIPIDDAGGRAALSEQTGNSAGAAANLAAQNAALNTQRIKQKYATDDPRYWANLKQIADNKVKIAQLLAEPTVLALQLANAGTNDAATRAANNLVIAQQQLAAGQQGHVSAAQMGALQQGVAAAGLGQAQTSQAVTEAQIAAQNASIRSGTGQAQAQLNAALQREGAYRSGALRDDATYYGAVAQETQARIALSDATHADAASVYDAAMALDRLRGNEVGAAGQALAKAYSDYNYAAAQYGASSQQAREALAATYSAQQSANSAQLNQLNAALDYQSARLTVRGDSVGVAQAALKKAQNALAAYRSRGGQTGTAEYYKLIADAETAGKAVADARLASVNAALDLQIAQLNARGALGDSTRAAELTVKKAQNALNAYRAVGGKSGTAQSDQLIADVATARRAQFDTALQAQLDTLDFQKETFKITSSQEVQSLQQILKNKQLTLAEQRSIILKIKDLQTSLRQQLTEGGLNIPSNIKLPTAYEVRRSLGGGFNGSATQISNVNNNQRVSVAITNTVPTAAVASQIANQVIAIINQQTGQQQRANSNTPRLIPTR